MLEDETAPKWTKSYFTGVPAPAGAGLAMIPLFSALAFENMYQPDPLLVALWMIVAGGLMISRLPTLAMKGRQIAPAFFAPVLAAICLLAAGLFTKTFVTLTVISTGYFLLLPVGYLLYHRREKIEALKG
jgi:CDP-diacylglycerol--serine O-phosphatidyltransferase